MQFDKVEYADETATANCVACGQPITDTYFEANGKIVEKVESVYLKPLHFSALKYDLAAMIPPPLTGALWLIYLTGILEREGFTIERGCAGMPTCYVATFRHGNGGPVIGIMGDIDGQEHTPARIPAGGLAPRSAVALDLAVVRPGVVVREQLPDRLRVHHAARELVGAGDLALLDHGDIGEGHPLTLPPSWQEINGTRHSCHWWQECLKSMITAMTFLILILLALTIRLLTTWVRHDNYAVRAQPTCFA